MTPFVTSLLHFSSLFFSVKSLDFTGHFGPEKWAVKLQEGFFCFFCRILTSPENKKSIFGPPVKRVWLLLVFWIQKVDFYFHHFTFHYFTHKIRNGLIKPSWRETIASRNTHHLKSPGFLFLRSSTQRSLQWHG